MLDESDTGNRGEQAQHHGADRDAPVSLVRRGEAADEWAGEDEQWLADQEDPDPADPVGFFRALVILVVLGAAFWTLVILGVRSLG